MESTSPIVDDKFFPKDRPLGLSLTNSMLSRSLMEKTFLSLISETAYILKGDLSSCQHGENILFLDLFGQLNLSLEIRVHDLHDPFAILESSVAKLIWKSPSAAPTCFPNLAEILLDRPLPTIRWLVEGQSISNF